SPTDGYILSRIDGTTSVREVIQRLSLPAEEVQRSIFGLLATGVEEHAAGPPKVPRKEAPMRARPVAPPAAPSPAPPPAPVAVSAPREGSADTQAKRREIMEAYETLRAKSHFEALGIERTATDAQVKEAYFRLARRFHPDTHHDPNMADLRDKLETVFIRLGEAYEVLRNRSVGMFRKALELKPENEEALAELAALGPEPEATEQGGFLKKLFGRR